MQGFELKFIAPRSHRHKHRPTLDAIVDLAKTNDIRRYTRRSDNESVGSGGHTHSAHFFELTDEPEELAFVLDSSQASVLLKAVEEAGIEVFCVRRAIEYWYFGSE